MNPKARASNIKINGKPLDSGKNYTYASYWFATDPVLINRVPAGNIQIAVRGENGKVTFVPRGQVTPENAMDGTEVVAQYLADNLRGQLATVTTGRINLLKSLPRPLFGNAEVQALRGAERTLLCPGKGKQALNETVQADKYGNI